MTRLGQSDKKKSGGARFALLILSTMSNPHYRRHSTIPVPLGLISVMTI